MRASNTLSTDNETIFLKKIADFSSYFLEEGGAEANYIIGVLVEDLAVMNQLTLSPAASLGITLGWNYLDGFYAIMFGMKQMLDEENYHQTQNKIKGMINIISGIQLIAFSYNPLLTGLFALSGGAALAGPSFTLAMLCDVLTAAIDLYNADKENQFEGWLEERVKEVNYIDERLVSVIDNNKKTEFRNKKMELLRIIGIRRNVHCDAERDLTKWADIILQNLKNKKDRDAIHIKEPTNSDRVENRRMRDALALAYHESCVNFGIKTFSFIGMAFLAVSSFLLTSPAFLPLFALGFAITTVVATYYLVKHSDKIVNQCSPLAGYLQHLFFSIPRLDPNHNSANNVCSPY